MTQSLDAMFTAAFKNMSPDERKQLQAFTGGALDDVTSDIGGVQDGVIAVEADGSRFECNVDKKVEVPLTLGECLDRISAFEAGDVKPLIDVHHKRHENRLSRTAILEIIAAMNGDEINDLLFQYKNGNPEYAHVLFMIPVFQEMGWEYDQIKNVVS